MERNPDILKAQREIERTQGVVITAKSTLYPQVGLSGRLEERNDDFLRQGTNPDIQRFRDFWIVQLLATQSLYSGGVNRQQIAIAKLTHENSMIQFQGAVDLVLRNVKVAVYSVVVNQAQMDAQQKSIDLLNKEEAQQKALFDAGRTTRFNVLRVQVDIGNQKSVLYQTQADLISSQIELSKLLNIQWPRKQSPFNPPFAVQENLHTPLIENLNVDELVGLALSRRPELQVLTNQISIAERQIKIDKAALVPKIDAYVSDQNLRDQSDATFTQSVNSYAVGLLGTWNIFDGFASKGQTITDTAVLGTAHISRDQTGLQVESEVRDSYARLMIAQQTVASQVATVKTAEESVGLAQLSADNGYATLLDVLQATLDLTAARIQEIRTRQQYLTALADLERAISIKVIDWQKDGLTTNSPIPAANSAPSPHATSPGVLR